MNNIKYIKIRRSNTCTIYLIREGEKGLYFIKVDDVVVYESKSFNRALSYYNCICFAMNRTRKDMRDYEKM